MKEFKAELADAGKCSGNKLSKYVSKYVHLYKESQLPVPSYVSMNVIGHAIPPGNYVSTCCAYANEMAFFGKTYSIFKLYEST